MSDIDIDELVREHFPCITKVHGYPHERPPCPECDHGDRATALARAVAERVKAEARVCPGCAGVGRYYDTKRKIRDCNRCEGHRGVTFGGG